MSRHIPCEKCIHCTYWSMQKEPLLGIGCEYIWDVDCELGHDPADKCSDYKRKPLRQRLKEVFG